MSRRAARGRWRPVGVHRDAPVGHIGDHVHAEPAVFAIERERLHDRHQNRHACS